MKKVLIAVVEDDMDDMEFICSALEDHSNHIEIVSFPGGHEFLDFMQTSSNLPDLVVTDLRMPLISGFEIIRKLKEDEVTKNTTILVLSTSSNEMDIEKAKSLGAAGYFVKPYNLKGYAEITTKIIENLGLRSLSFSSMLENFYQTFQFLRLPRRV